MRSLIPIPMVLWAVSLAAPAWASPGGHGELAARVAEAKVVVVRGSADHMEQVLSRAHVAYVAVDPSELPELPLNAHQVLMVNCTGDMSAAARERVRRFVAAGGFLYTTDHAVHQLIEPIFPGTIAWTGASTTEQIVPVRLHGNPDDRGLLANLGGEANEHWQLASGGYPFKVLDKSKVEVLMDSPSAAHQYGAGAIAVRFHYQDGVVIHVTGHFFTQPGQTGAVAQAGRAFETLSANVVASKAEDEVRIDRLYSKHATAPAKLQAAPSTSSAGGAAVAPGAALRELGRKDGYVQVRDDQGNEGWMPAAAIDGR